MSEPNGPLRPAQLRVYDLLGLFAVALAVRLVFAWKLPYASADWVLYGDVARNILNGCGVAISTPEGCRPHFGGNQLPLFPALAALVWSLTGPSEFAIMLVQSLIAAAATVRLAHAAAQFAGSRAVGLAVGAVQAASPVQAFWAGHLLTETLAMASTQWVLAELLLGHAQRRFRVVAVGTAMTFAVWVRLDGVLLAVPVLVGALLTERPVRALRGCVLAGLMTVASLGAWTVRNVAVGISPVPIYGVLPDGTQGPQGYVAWVRSWVVREQDRAAALFFGTNAYDRIRIADSAFRSAEERAAVEDLLRQLRSAAGQRFPAEIDAQFAALAERRQAEKSGIERAVLFLARAGELMRPWVWPWGRQDAHGARAWPSPTDVYRFAIVLGVAVAGLVRPRGMTMLLGLALSFTAARIGFFALTANIELRYLVELAPLLEAVAAVVGVRLAERMWRRPVNA